MGWTETFNSKIRNWFLHFNTKVINLRNLSQILSVRCCYVHDSSYILIRPQKSPNIIWCYIISSKKVRRFFQIFLAFLQNMNVIFIILEIELLQSRLHSYIVIGWNMSRRLEFSPHWLSARLACESTFVVHVQIKSSQLNYNVLLFLYHFILNVKLELMAVGRYKNPRGK